MTARFINPFTDFGFKKLFGEEANKDILLDFLNEILREEQGEIKSLTFLKSERIGSLDMDRRAVFDLCCENGEGAKFIVEMQKAKQDFFKERSVFYATFPNRDQARKGTWNYDLKAVYTVGILDFIFDEDRGEPEKFLYRVKLSDIETSEVFYDKLTFIYLEMPKFTKPLEACRTHFDKWMYVLRNLEKRPAKLKERIFRKVFGEAEIASFNQSQLDDYEENLKVYRDMHAVLETAKNEGRAAGAIENATSTVRRMLAKGMDVSVIAELTGLRPEATEAL